MLKSIVLSVEGAKHDNFRTLVYRKSDKTWHELKVPGGVSRNMRGFGKYISIVEAPIKKAVAVQLASGTVHINEDVRTKEKSAGHAEWRKERSFLGPNMEEAFEVADAVYPAASIFAISKPRKSTPRSPTRVTVKCCLLRRIRCTTATANASTQRRLPRKESVPRACLRLQKKSATHTGHLSNIEIMHGKLHTAHHRMASLHQNLSVNYSAPVACFFGSGLLISFRKSKSGGMTMLKNPTIISSHV